jgi:lipopolysaccharide/colanic/teichoic acid biosynthesis glycosyltransferase
MPLNVSIIQPLPLWKRTTDVVLALLCFVLLSPLILATAAFVKIVSPGPVFYKSKRVGFGGEEFMMWKFRSMHVNGDQNEHREYMKKLIRTGGQSSGRDRVAMTKNDSDSRLIPMAALIRKTCLDELPQLINVLRGEMSLVGPRPAIAYETVEYDRWHCRRLDVVPGMTGLWQVSGKNRLTFREMVALDIRYSREMSLWLDLRILLFTVPAILGQIADYRAKRRKNHV